MTRSLLSFSEPVQNAFKKNKPVIALESSIISQGMPYPQNIKLANRLEEIALQNGITPATICIMNGKIKIGLTDKELELLAKDPDVRKVSSRDIGKVLIDKKIGATTVSATMKAADLAGIKVLATGGIGGVHRFAEESFDISADLNELSHTPVIVVSAGAKAILDLPRTLEYLETLGVPVYGYKTDDFPAFYSSGSGLKIIRINSAKEIVEIYKKNISLGFKNGILITNPIPGKFEIPYSEMEKFIDMAIKKSKKKKIKGKALTPYLLQTLVEITSGRSLDANVKLVENNVLLACKIAKEF